MQKYIARERLTVADDTTVTRGGSPTDVYLASDVDARIAELEKILGNVHAAVTTNMPGFTLADVQDMTRPFARPVS